MHRPSLNLALYEGGRSSFYLLHELAPEACTWGEGAWQMGGSSMQRRALPDGRVELKVQLDCPVPALAERLIGSLRWVGAPSALPELGASPHRWIPQIPHAAVEVDLRCGALCWSWTGRGYHDGNCSSRSLPHLGIRRWWWGRLARPQESLLWYRVEGEGEPVEWLLRARPDGSGELLGEAVVELEGWRPGLFGLSGPRRLRLRARGLEPLSVELRHRVDDGPFYQRYLCDDGAGGAGTVELVVPGRIDLGWMRPLVRMRVSGGCGRPSFWLPLFTGPRSGRLLRLLRPAPLQLEQR
jgi:hypothetical protein